MSNTKLLHIILKLHMNVSVIGCYRECEECVRNHLERTHVLFPTSTTTSAAIGRTSWRNYSDPRTRHILLSYTTFRMTRDTNINASINLFNAVNKNIIIIIIIIIINTPI